MKEGKHGHQSQGVSKLQGIDEEGERWKDRGLWSKDEMLKFLKIKELDSPLDSDHPVQE